MISDNIRNTVFIGCGSFTTFSTFSKEALMMLQAGNFFSLLAYVAISVIAGIALVAAGYYLVRL